MGGRSDVQFRCSPGLFRTPVEIEDSQQMGVPPAPQQQHRLAQPGLRGVMAAPGGAVCRILRQPATGHSVGVVSLQQFRPVPEVAAVLQCSTDRFPGVGVPTASRLLGGQLQTPAQV